MQIISLDQIRSIERQMRIAGIAITFLKYVPVIIGVMASISLILSAFNFAEASYFWAIVNLILGAAGASMVAGMIKGHIEHSRRVRVVEPSSTPSASAAA